jgi:cephalosporin hydroxylase
MSLETIINPIPGWCTIEKAQKLSDLVVKTDSKLTIELGVFGGRSLAAFAYGHKQKGSGFCIGIDAWKAAVAIEGTNSPLNDEYWKNVVNYKDVYNACQNMIHANHFEDYCDTLRMKSQQAAIMFNNNCIDIIHQDSGHNYETITKEIELWFPKLKKGGYWIADDTDWVEAVDGYSQLKVYGLELVEDFTKWQIWKKV